MRDTTDKATTSAPSWRDFMPIHPAANLFPMMTTDEQKALGEDIKKRGLVSGIVIWEDKAGQQSVLDGRNRLDAMEQLGGSLICDGKLTSGIHQVCIYEGSGTDPFAYVISANIHRRHLDESQRAMIAARLATMERGDNQYASIEATSQSRAAGLLSVARSSVQRAREVIDHGVPELQSAVDAGAVAVSAAAGIATLDADQQRALLAQCDSSEIKKAARIIRAKETDERITARLKRHAALATAMPMPDRRYPVILADPPWRFEVASDSGSWSTPDAHYPTMTIDEIAALPVPAADAAVLFLWSTVPHLLLAGGVMKAWGFDYVSNMVWVKNRMGLGYWVRNRHEHLLIGVKGSFPTPPASVKPDSVIDAPIGRHSEKPASAYEIIERCYPDVPKIELFARAQRKGWATWGNEVPPLAAGAESAWRWRAVARSRPCWARRRSPPTI